jgi:hypothetical protein
MTYFVFGSGPDASKTYFMPFEPAMNTGMESNCVFPVAQ